MLVAVEHGLLSFFFTAKGNDIKGLSSSIIREGVRTSLFIRYLENTFERS